MSSHSWVTSEPPPAADGAGPVMLLLHGYGSHERDLPGITPLLPPLPWVSVRAPLPLPAGGAAWFDLALPDEPAAQGIERATHQLWGWIDEHLPAETALVPVGFSQGGVMATQLLRTRPERIAATVVLAGFVGTAPQAADAQLEHSLPAVFWGRGDRDQVIWPEAIDRTSRVLPRLATVTERVYPGLAHGVNEAMLADVRTFLIQAVGAGSEVSPAG